jgi:hypothetical protein
MQRYVQPNKNRKLIYRFNYFCNLEKYRKANYIEILTPLNTNTKHLCYNINLLKVLYKTYKDTSKLEDTAKKIAYMISLSSLVEVGVMVGVRT